MENKNEKKWEIVKKLNSGAGYSDSKTQELKPDEVIDILLENRGIKTKKDKKEFFGPTDPKKLSLKELGISQHEVNKAVTRVKKAIKSKEKVIVYGDYDADGISGTAILWETLYSLGLNVLPYIPERFTEGYGLNAESIKKLKQESPDLGLIITVDHGIVANKKVDFAKSLGVDVIITDHHEPEKKKPEALAAIHTTKIGGAAVAWIFSRELSRSDLVSKRLELVAIGTIADQLPLVGPNRSFAKWGLEALNKTKRLGLLALFEETGMKQGRTLNRVGPYEVGFLIAPRINAMGRLEHAMQSLRLLCTKDRLRAKTLAEDLNRVNLERQKVVNEVVEHARSSMSQKKLDKIIVLAHESYHEGVIGLAASKLVEEFYRPAIVLAKKEKIAKASARSIPGFNIIEAIRKLEGFLLEGGGHPMAAGFSIDVNKIDEFAKKLKEISDAQLTDEILTKKLKIDLELEFENLTPRLFEKIHEFEPFGLGNPTPTFVTGSVEIQDGKVVGKEGAHLKLKLKKDDTTFDAIGFGFGSSFGQLSPGAKVDLAYSLEENTWNGKKNLELRIKDIRI